jgi:hypothetical protein
VIASDELGDGVQTIEGVIGDFEVQRGKHGTIGGESTVKGHVAECKNIRGCVVMEVIHALIEASVSGGLDDGTREIKIVEHLESPGIPQKNPEARIGYDASVSSSGRAYVNTTTEGAEFR